MLLDSLYSKDKVSHSHSVKVEIQRFLADGTIDIGVDITIMGGDLFYKVAIIDRQRKRPKGNGQKATELYQTPFILN